MKEAGSHQDVSNRLANQAIQDEKNQIFDQQMIQIGTDADRLVKKSKKLVQDIKKLNQDIKNLISQKH